MQVPEKLALIGGSILLASLLVFTLKDQTSTILPHVSAQTENVMAGKNVQKERADQQAQKDKEAKDAQKAKEDQEAQKAKQAQDAQKAKDQQAQQAKQAQDAQRAKENQAATTNNNSNAGSSSNSGGSSGGSSYVPPSNSSDGIPSVPGEPTHDPGKAMGAEYYNNGGTDTRDNNPTGIPNNFFPPAPKGGDVS